MVLSRGLSRTLGLGLFFPLPGQELEKLIPENTSLDTLAALALEAGEGSMSATLPGLLASRLEPLAPYPGENQGSGESFWKRAEVAAKNKDEGFFDPRSAREAILAWGFAAGPLRPRQGLEILLLYYEKAVPCPSLPSPCLVIADWKNCMSFSSEAPFLVFSPKLERLRDQTGVSGTLAWSAGAGGGPAFFNQVPGFSLTETGPQVFFLSADATKVGKSKSTTPAFRLSLIQARERLVNRTRAGIQRIDQGLEWEN
jgi:hypothetical protein